MLSRSVAAGLVVFAVVVAGMFAVDLDSARARKGYGGGGYSPCGAGCQRKKCLTDCKKHNRTCVYCAKKDVKQAVTTCRDARQRTLAECTGDPRQCKSEAKTAFTGCKAGARDAFNGRAADCRGRNGGPCASCCGAGDTDSCAAAFDGTEGYPTVFRTYSNYGRTRRVKPNCEAAGSPGKCDKRRCPDSSTTSTTSTTLPRGGACFSDSNCADGDPCNGVERCVAGTCQPGTPPDCDRQDDFCTDWQCINYGGSPYCSPTSKTPPTCDDGNACNGSETYNCATGQCVAGMPFDCDQYDDFCNDYTCSSAFNYAQCTATALPHQTCDDGNGCNGSETYNCATGRCEAGTPLDCDQYDDFCYDYACASFGGSPQCVIVHETPPRTDCDDGDACNGSESYSCQTGQCVGTAPVFCPPGTHCVSNFNSPSCVSNS